MSTGQEFWQCSLAGKATEVCNKYASKKVSHHTGQGSQTCGISTYELNGLRIKQARCYQLMLKSRQAAEDKTKSHKN